MVQVDVEAVQPITASAGVNIATITGTAITTTDAMFVWGTATGGPYPNATPFQNPARETYDDGTFAWRYRWELTGVQQAANTVYFGKVLFADGTSSSELTWTQPGLNANANDIVNFQRNYQSRLARVSSIASKAATQGWLTVEEFNFMQAAAFYTSFYNTITWVDGR